METAILLFKEYSGHGMIVTLFLLSVCREKQGKQKTFGGISDMHFACVFLSISYNFT